MILSFGGNDKFMQASVKDALLRPSPTDWRELKWDIRVGYELWYMDLETAWSCDEHIVLIERESATDAENLKRLQPVYGEWAIEFLA